MLASLTRVTGGNWFPLCRSTTSRLTFEEPINRHLSAGSYWCPQPSITEQTWLKNTRSFSWEKNPLNSFWRLRRKHVSVSGWEYSVRLVWNLTVQFKSRTCSWRFPWMGFRWGTPYFKCRIAVNIVPFLLCVFFIRIRLFITKSQMFRKLWYRQLFTVWARPHYRW